ncbi:glucosamine inositolphosphorylceramide transferase family protein [Halpernia frigidisoli]|uniref:Glucosamine inositolphosphorylceramide transferase 1 N-terminal domain-containing protein n=1 Tax=Halpernia frigidisoli TaxID=1125876 RepID=A0A1I3HID2_9FLAO|nr:hypothetical protein [Halpernia frigidisoli]SFI35494.1 hypothetical protein SAMN05443292_2227 [Halpernia frigidisoli]
MNKIIWVVKSNKIENYLFQSIINICEQFPNEIFEIFIDSNLKDSNIDYFKIFKRVDVHFKSFKDDPFSLKNLSQLNFPGLKIIDKTVDLSVSEWVIFENELNSDYSDYTKLSQKGLIIFNHDSNEIKPSILNKNKKLTVDFKIKRSGKNVWKNISNMSFIPEKGLLNSLEKKYWLLNLSLAKFLKNENDFTEIFRGKSVKISKFKIGTYYFNLISSILQRKISKKEYNWKIGFKQNGGKTIMLKQPQGTFWADPFLVKENDELYLFIEELNLNKIGEIACLKLDQNFEIVEKRTVLSDQSHFSFPNVFYKNGNYYMLPENSEKDNLTLYKATSFPFEWTFERNLMENIKLLDAVWIFHNNLYWLFANKINDHEFDNNDNLYLYYSDDLLNGEWKFHAQNPIITDSGKARNAGQIFVKNGKMFRPSQNCSETYGANLVMNEILELTTTNYSETISEEIFPPKPFVGLHTFNSVEGIEVYDFLKEE